MESPEHVEDVSGSREDIQTGHWLPALRPDTIDKSRDQSAGFDAPRPDVDIPPVPHAQIDIIPPTPVSRLAEKVDLFRNRVPVVPEEPNEPTINAEPQSTRTATTTPAWSHPPTETSNGDDELPSEDDDEWLDPAWGIKRMDSANILDTVHRSTTFPDLSPPESSHLRTESDGLGDEILEEDEAANGTEEAEIIAEQDKNATEPQSMDWTGGNDVGSREPQSWTVQLPEKPVDEADERYEEGVPLIQTGDEDDVVAESSSQYAFETAQDEEETSFFSNINGSDSTAPEMPMLDRKSPAQVLSSLHLLSKNIPESPMVDASIETSFFDELATSNEPPAGTITSAGAETQQADDMWAAALGDDEFLVEDADDLLPDSDEEESVALPPVQAAPSVPPHLPRRQISFNPYAPHQPSTSDMFQLSQTTRTTHNNMGLSQQGLPPMGSFQAQIPQRPPAQSVQSFVDQAKDGYVSPYDLPVDLQPKRRSRVPPPVQTTRSCCPSASEQQSVREASAVPTRCYQTAVIWLRWCDATSAATCDAPAKHIHGGVEQDRNAQDWVLVGVFRRLAHDLKTAAHWTVYSTAIILGGASTTFTSKSACYVPINPSTGSTTIPATAFATQSR